MGIPRDECLKRAMHLMFQHVKDKDKDKAPPPPAQARREASRQSSDEANFAGQCHALVHHILYICAMDDDLY
jgi:hypothetical protein